MERGKITQEQAIEEAGKPIKIFLAKYAREKDIKFYFWKYLTLRLRVRRTTSSSKF
jgi:flagellar biosynthesis protein FliP